MALRRYPKSTPDLGRGTHPSLASTFRTSEKAAAPVSSPSSGGPRAGKTLKKAKSRILLKSPSSTFQFPLPTQPHTQIMTSSSSSSEALFQFAKIPFGDFEGCLSWIQAYPSLDYCASRDMMLWQASKTFERLLKQDFEPRHLSLVQDFANQCVQQYALLDYGADCGYERLRHYLHDLVLTSEWARNDYLSRMMNLDPPQRLEFITRPVPGHLEKLRWFCLLFDHLYEKIEQETRNRMERPALLRHFQSPLEKLQSRFSSGRGANNGNVGDTSDPDIGRAI